MIESILFLLIGIFSGAFTGLLPGIHSNSVSFYALEFLDFRDFNAALFFVGLAVSQSFFDFIPAVLFGASGTESFLSILPGQKFFLKGKAFHAIKLTAIGGLIAGLTSFLLIPVYFFALSEYSFLLNYLIPFVLVSIILLSIFSEKSFEKKMISFYVIFSSGFLGLLVLNDFILVESNLFVLISGFFVFPQLFCSLIRPSLYVEQKISSNNYLRKKLMKFSFIGCLSGLFVSIFPGIGNAQAAFISSKIFRKINSASFLIILGAINTTNLIFSFTNLFASGKTRSGAAVALKESIDLSFQNFILISAAVLFSIGFSFLLILFVSKKIVLLFNKINYVKLNFFVLAFLVLLMLFSTNFMGLIVLMISFFTGLIPVSMNSRRSNLMAFLMFPSIYYYLAI